MTIIGNKGKKPVFSPEGLESLLADEPVDPSVDGLSVDGLPKGEETKGDDSIDGLPKGEGPKCDLPKGEGPKGDDSTDGLLKGEGPKRDLPKGEVPKGDLRVDGPPKLGGPVYDPPTNGPPVDSPPEDGPPIDNPSVDGPSVEASTDDPCAFRGLLRKTPGFSLSNAISISECLRHSLAYTAQREAYSLLRYSLNCSSPSNSELSSKKDE